MPFPIGRTVLRVLHHAYARYGNKQYTISEPCSILDHSLQVAYWSYCNSQGDPVATVSGLLHDYGHIIQGSPIDPKQGLDDHHEFYGARALAEMGFPIAVTEPICLHVAAKRYLMTKNPKYKLSEGSHLSFQLQGGFMSKQEMGLFEQSQFFNQALLLRYADDRGKSIGVSHRTKSIMDYGWLIQLVLNNQTKF